MRAWGDAYRPMSASALQRAACERYPSTITRSNRIFAPTQTIGIDVTNPLQVHAEAISKRPYPSDIGARANTAPPPPIGVVRDIHEPTATSRPDPTLNEPSRRLPNGEPPSSVVPSAALS